MVYVDALMARAKTKYWRHDSSCHLVADTKEELHAFVASIGMAKNKCHYSNSGIFHYDLTPPQRDIAIAAGAISVDRAQFFALGLGIR